MSGYALQKTGAKKALPNNRGNALVILRDNQLRLLLTTS